MWESDQDGSAFCPNCGAAASNQSGDRYSSQQNYGGGNYNQNQNPSNNYGPSGGPQGSSGLGGTLTIILVLGIIWAVCAIVSGILLFAGGSVFIFFLTGPVLIVAGILSLLSGLFALLCCMNIYKLEKHHDAYVYCLIGSILALFVGGIIAGVLGIIFAFLLKKEQYRFKS
ncbi:MAG: hypothetical protein LBU30_05820 [Candidatus Methanoplasma sp.]|jgi:hypothetical protein|nr:hypothetical protein [Candidatus Methanoplasma sp.]